MKRSSTPLLALALALAASPLHAQDNPPPRPPENLRRDNASRQASGLFSLLDANRDGAIDSEEINRAGDALRQLDRDRDGKVTADETRPPGEAQRPPAWRRDEPRRPGGESARPDGPRRETASRAEGPRDPHATNPSQNRGPQFTPSHRPPWAPHPPGPQAPQAHRFQPPHFSPPPIPAQREAPHPPRMPQGPPHRDHRGPASGEGERPPGPPPRAI